MGVPQEVKRAVASANRTELLFIIAAAQVKLAALGYTEIPPMAEDLTKAVAKNVIKHIRKKQSLFVGEDVQFLEKIIHHIRANWLHKLYE